MDFGSGHLTLTHAADPGLVYDATYTDYLLFACASIKAQMDPSFPCPPTAPSPTSLNYPSLAIYGLKGTVHVNRTVTNVGRKKAQYKVFVDPPAGVVVKISPKILTFREIGEKKSFVITVTAKVNASGRYEAGSYAWDGGIHVVRSPIVVSVAK